MMHAILEHRDGLLVIPDSRGTVILERRNALDFLNREIRESSVSYTHLDVYKRQAPSSARRW